ncbi:MAG: S8 family peptidase [Myxococcota bacterium]
MRSPRTLILPALLAMPLTSCDNEIVDNALFGVYFIELNAEAAEVADLANSLATQFDLEIRHIYDSAGRGLSVRLPRLVVPELEQIDYVRTVIEDPEREYVPDDEPLPDFEYGDGEVTPDIIRIGGPVGNGNYSDVHVAVIDTGIDGDHPDLNVVGVFDAVGISTPNDANDGDPNGHGTHVAGTIAALADGSGVAGVAPGASLHAVRVLGTDGSGYYSDIIAGIEYVLDNPQIRVVNMSLGGPLSSATDPLRDAIQELLNAGVIVCIAAGNESQDTANVAPAGYDDGVIVSAYDASNGSDNGFAWFSNFGDEVDIAAPGVQIYSTWPGGGYEALDGTSMATPHVAGAAVVFASTRPNADNAAFLSAITSNGEDGYSGQGGDHPEPLLDLNAVQ